MNEVITLPRVFVGIGSNVEPDRWIAKAIADLRGRFGELTISPIYRNKPVGFGGDDFLNLVIAFNTPMPLRRLAKGLKKIERDCGRRRGAERFVSRTLDIDILLYGDLCTQKDGFEIPRAEILEANYVLKPLVDIAKDCVHPSTGKTFGEHWASFQSDGHRLIEVPLA